MVMAIIDLGGVDGVELGGQQGSVEAIRDEDAAFDFFQAADIALHQVFQTKLKPVETISVVADSGENMKERMGRIEEEKGAFAGVGKKRQTLIQQGLHHFFQIHFAVDGLHDVVERFKLLNLGVQLAVIFFQLVGAVGDEPFQAAIEVEQLQLGVNAGV